MNNKILAIDVGQSVTGLATTDKTGTIPMPYKNIKEKNVKNLAKRIFQIYTDLNINLILIGYPLNLNNTKSEQTLYVESFAKELEKLVDPDSLKFVDEKYSTIIANRNLKDIGLNRKQRSKIIDSNSALVLLQEYCDSK